MVFLGIGPYPANAIELLVRQILSESVGLALDSKAFDATAGDTTRVGGLLNDINAKTASNSTVPSEAMAADIGTLVGEVAATAGNNPIVFVASPKQAAALRLWAKPNFNFDVLSSGALTDGTVIAIAANALVSACDPVPRFEVSNATTLHFEDTNPAISTRLPSLPRSSRCFKAT
jgi:hypothetical protein